MDTKTYLDKFTQSFDTEDDLNIYVSLMSTYLSPDRITTEGPTVTVRPANRSESWFLTLLTLSTAFTRAGIALPKNINDTFVYLASNLGTPHADEVADYFDRAGISQHSLLEEAQKLSS